MIQELNKMAMIHLYLLGYSGEDLNNFSASVDQMIQKMKQNLSTS
jgi:hypothetical protein